MKPRLLICSVPSQRNKMADLELARKQLIVALGEFGERYWSNIKLWYKQKITKEDFDTQAFQLLGPGKIHFHNEFLLAILARCHALISAPASVPQKAPQKSVSKTAILRKPKVKKSSQHVDVKLQHQFSSVNPIDQMPLAIQKANANEELDNRLCSYELALPDVPTLHGRLYLGAWEASLDSVADDTASLLFHSVEAYIKNILTACVARRKRHRLRDGHFRHSFGLCSQKINQQRGIKRPVDGRANPDAAESEAMFSLASGHTTPIVLPPISTFDLRDTLQVNRGVVPSHASRAGNMERVFSELWHPGHEEIEQNQLYKLETKRFNEILKQQRGLRS